MKGLLGVKLGMTRVFSDAGVIVPVTVVKVGPCIVFKVKTLEKDGYFAIQIGFLEKKNPSIPQKGFSRAAGVKAPKYLKEIRSSAPFSSVEGDVLSCSLFEVGDFVQVRAFSKGKGFQGVIKRHHKAGGPKTHGSTFHRSTGSIGQRTYPGKVFKNMKLPGRMGGRCVTVKNLEIVGLSPDLGLLFIQGSVPGAKGELVLIKSGS